MNDNRVPQETADIFNAIADSVLAARKGGDPFGKFKNPNGTYDGAALMSEMTGIPKDVIIAEWKRLKAARNDPANP